MLWVYLSIDDPCLPNPCKNDGNCTRTADLKDFTCNCTSEYTGDTCENKIGRTASKKFKRKVVVVVVKLNERKKEENSSLLRLMEF